MGRCTSKSWHDGAIDTHRAGLRLRLLAAAWNPASASTPCSPAGSASPARPPLIPGSSAGCAAPTTAPR